MTLDTFLIVFVIVGTWAIVQYLMGGRYPLAERIGWVVFALSVLYIGVDTWIASVDSIRDGYFVRVARAKFRSISYYRIVTSLKDDPVRFWTNVAVRLLVCTVLVYSSTLAFRRAMKRS